MTEMPSLREGLAGDLIKQSFEKWESAQGGRSYASAEGASFSRGRGMHLGKFLNLSSHTSRFLHFPGVTCHARHAQKTNTSSERKRALGYRFLDFSSISC